MRPKWLPNVQAFTFFSPIGEFCDVFARARRVSGRTSDLHDHRAHAADRALQVGRQPVARRVLGARLRQQPRAASSWRTWPCAGPSSTASLSSEKRDRGELGEQRRLERLEAPLPLGLDVGVERGAPPVALAVRGALELDALEQEQESGGIVGDVRRALGRRGGKTKGASLEPFSNHDKPVAVPKKATRRAPVG